LEPSERREKKRDSIIKELERHLNADKRGEKASKGNSFSPKDKRKGVLNAKLGQSSGKGKGTG